MKKWKKWYTAPPWLNGSSSTMRDWRSWVQFPWVTSTFNVDIARIFVFYLAMVRNCCGLLWWQSRGCSYLPYTMSAKAVRWEPLDRVVLDSLWVLVGFPIRAGSPLEKPRWPLQGLLVWLLVTGSRLTTTVWTHLLSHKCVCLLPLVRWVKTSLQRAVTLLQTRETWNIPEPRTGNKAASWPPCSLGWSGHKSVHLHPSRKNCWSASQEDRSPPVVNLGGVSSKTYFLSSRVSETPVVS